MDGVVSLRGSGEFSEAQQESKSSNPHDEMAVHRHQAMHQLHSSWKLWVFMHRFDADQQQKGKWSDQQRAVYEFSTVEDYWCLATHSHQASKLDNADYSLFKNNVTPAWEDASCKQGGRWVAKLIKVKAQSLDNLWQALSLALIGEAWSAENVDLVVGGVVSVRSRASKVSLWLNNAKDEAKVISIGQQFREVCASTPGLTDISAREFSFEDFRKQEMTITLRTEGTVVSADNSYQ